MRSKRAGPRPPIAYRTWIPVRCPPAFTAISHTYRHASPTHTHVYCTPVPQNLRDMVYMLNGTPRAVEASLTLPGQRSAHAAPSMHGVPSELGRRGQVRRGPRAAPAAARPVEAEASRCRCGCSAEGRFASHITHSIHPSIHPSTHPLAHPCLRPCRCAGPPRGSQSTYDRALRAVFGADDSALQGGRPASPARAVAPTRSALPAAHCAAHAPLGGVHTHARHPLPGAALSQLPRRAWHATLQNTGCSRRRRQVCGSAR